MNDYKWYLGFVFLVVSVTFVVAGISEHGRQVTQRDCIRAGHSVVECKTMR
jgi:hypothetical protein